MLRHEQNMSVAWYLHASHWSEDLGGGCIREERADELSDCSMEVSLFSGGAESIIN